MRRLMVLAAGIVFVFSASVFAIDGTSQAPAKADPSKAVSVKPPKETKVSIIGVVRDISDTMISVERTVRGKTETMEFTSKLYSYLRSKLIVILFHLNLQPTIRHTSGGRSTTSARVDPRVPSTRR